MRFRSHVSCVSMFANTMKVFIVHGWTYTTEKWNECVRLLKERGVEAVLLNVPGLTAESNKSWTIDEYVEWLHDSLAGEQSPIVVGHSNGGRIVLACALKYPNFFSRLILIGSAGIVHKEIPLRIKRAVAMVAAKIAKPIVRSEKLRTRLYRLIGGGDYGNANPLMRQTMAELVKIDLAPRLSEIAVPTTLIWGQRDTLTPIAEGELMHKLIKNSQLYVFSDAGHSPHATHAQEVVEMILGAVKQA